jgi:hypothetical protein
MDKTIFSSAGNSGEAVQQTSKARINKSAACPSI